MLNRIIRIAAAACTLFLAGCARTLGPVESDGAIRFTAGSPLLRDDATKAGVPKDAFGNGDSFFVWGAKTISTTRHTVFSGVQVTLDTQDDDNPLNDVWDYDNHRFWDSNASQYDFIAVSGPASAATTDCTPSNAGRLEADVSYSPLAEQYDLMAACYQRSPVTTDRIDFQFQHILSAVSVQIINDSPTLPVTLNYYGFKFIATSGTCQLRQSGSSLATVTMGSWMSLGGFSSDILLGMKGLTPAVSPATLVTPSQADYEDPADPENPLYNFYPTSTVTDLMIPQDLDPVSGSVPQLAIEYVYDDGVSHTVPTTIPLREIKNRGSESSYITSWQPGKKYHYEIHIRLGGGIRVTVTTTDWDVVNAETPGLAIYDE